MFKIKNLKDFNLYICIKQYYSSFRLLFQIRPYFNILKMILMCDYDVIDKYNLNVKPLSWDKYNLNKIPSLNLCKYNLT